MSVASLHLCILAMLSPALFLAGRMAQVPAARPRLARVTLCLGTYHCRQPQGSAQRQQEPPLPGLFGEQKEELGGWKPVGR